ncbi:STM3941 family protein [Flavobacterium branchiophilum]|uniref:STM3941 family protein n=1 Tax=Flavobacterium branchiophilum TaxID=55197 RepID=UPI00117BDC3D|nr:STM3941 family protein [Flavobacterium branchiophilum]
MHNLEIQTNKTRIVLLTFIHLLSLVFGIIAVYYIYRLGYISIRLVLVLSVFLLIFPFVLYWCLKIIGNSNAGLVINNEGILDNIQFAKFGVVKWENIKGYRTCRVFFSDLILLDLLDNEVVMKNLNKIQKNNAQNRLENYGTPFVINLSNLKKDKEELINIISEHIKKTE